MNDDHNMELSHEQVSQALQVLFVDQDRQRAFAQVSARQVHRHLAGCRACQRQYDALALADRVLVGDGAQEDPAELPRAGFETSFGDAAFLGALDEMLTEEQQGAAVVDLSGRRGPLSPTARWLSAAAAVLLVGAGSWFAWQHLHGAGQHTSIVDNNPGEFQARSAASAAAHGPFAQPKLEVFCARKSAEGVELQGAKDAPFGLLRCPQDAELKLAYANPSPRLRYAAFFGVDQHGSIYWYGPTPAETGAVEVAHTSELRPFGESIRLAVNHRPGKVRVFGLFSVEPIDFARLRHMIDGLDAHTLFGDGLPGDLLMRGASTSSTFEVTHGGNR